MSSGKERQFIDELIGKKQLLVAEVNFLLGKAIPKLEHEYLYCIAMLEREAAVVQLQIALLAEEIRLREESVANNESVSEEKIYAALNTIQLQWESKINKHAYSSNNNTIIFPDFVHEREYRLFLLNSALDSLNSETSSSVKEYYTEFVRRISAAYREGNLGELRALRMIIESKQHLISEPKTQFSIKTFLQVIKIRITNFFTA